MGFEEFDRAADQIIEVHRAHGLQLLHVFGVVLGHLLVIEPAPLLEHVLAGHQRRVVVKHEEIALELGEPLLDRKTS